MYLEKEAIDYFRNYDIRNSLFHLENIPRSGNLPSRQNGRNMEFEKFSRYEPGDNIQDIDWKVYARSGKLFVKNYGLDTRTKIRIIVDHSQSMDYPGNRKQKKESKLTVAKKTAAILAYLLIKKQNTVRLTALNERCTDLGVVKPTTINSILKPVHPGGLARLREITAQKGMTAFLISDGWWSDFSPSDGAKYLEKQGIHFIHILSPDERDLSLTGDLVLCDMEMKERIPVVPSRIRKDYVRAMDELVKEYQKHLSQRGLLYRLCPLDRRYYVNLRHFLDQPFRRMTGQTKPCQASFQAVP